MAAQDREWDAGGTGDTGDAAPGEREQDLSREPRPLTVDVVIPVYNEERSLPGCVQVLSDYLGEKFPLPWTITVVDNASTDGTLDVANELTAGNGTAGTGSVRVRHLDRKGRGHALRTSWGASDADIVVYMDVDLSTGLDALLPLVAPLATGHSDVSIGSRLASGARTVRGPRRELISRGYNALIRMSHGARFTDAQCGFKAARTDVVRRLLEHVEDDAWFFDTELLLLAEHNGLRVHEVPVDWVEDTDTRVAVGRTVADDVRGLVRVARGKATGAARVPELPRRPDPAPIHPDATVALRDTGRLWRILSFTLIGVASTVATLALYAVFRQWWPYWGANFAALTICTLLNTEANRRLTFLDARQASSGVVHLQGLLVFALYYAFTSGALALMNMLVAHPSKPLELTVLLVASILGTAGRFVLLRLWIFRQPSSGKATA